MKSEFLIREFDTEWCVHIHNYLKLSGLFEVIVYFVHIQIVMEQLITMYNTYVQNIYVKIIYTFFLSLNIYMLSTNTLIIVNSQLDQDTILIIWSDKCNV